jgi:cyanophycinase
MSPINIKNPKGKLIAIGGAVDKGSAAENNNAEGSSVKFLEEGILRRLLEELSGSTNRIEIITTASKIPEEVGRAYLAAFHLLGSENVDVMHIKDKEDAQNPDYLKRIKDAEGVLFTGGDQLRLTDVFGESELLDILLDKYQNENFVLAGTSAGAMAMSSVMICRGSSSEALLKGEVMLSRGLGFIHDVTFDSHFIKRGRFGRLCQTVATCFPCTGIGLGEDTGLLITNGNHMEAIGSGLVMIVEGDHVKYTNVDDIEDGDPISIENLTVHVLSKGYQYILSEKKMIHR